jgi:hypothetical protein
MARFDLQNYETVAQRIIRFYSDHENGAIITKYLTTDADRDRKQWVVYAEVWFDKNTDARPTGTGLAFEIDGSAGANVTSALENCESSAVGRALAQANYGGDKRVTREEMAKVNRGPAKENQITAIDIQNAATLKELEALWARSVDSGDSTKLISEFTARKQALNVANKD